MRLFLSYVFALLLFSALAAKGQDESASSPSSSAGFTGSNISSTSVAPGVGMTVSQNYILKPSDVLEINVYQEPDLD